MAISRSAIGRMMRRNPHSTLRCRYQGSPTLPGSFHQAEEALQGFLPTQGTSFRSASMMAAEDDTVYMIETEYHSWDNWQNDCIAYDSFGPYATERGAKEALEGDDGG